MIIKQHILKLKHNHNNFLTNPWVPHTHILPRSHLHTANTSLKPPPSPPSFPTRPPTPPCRRRRRRTAAWLSRCRTALPYWRNTLPRYVPISPSSAKQPLPSLLPHRLHTLLADHLHHHAAARVAIMLHASPLVVPPSFVLLIPALPYLLRPPSPLPIKPSTTIHAGSTFAG